MAVQAHVHWAEQLVDQLGGTRAAVDETPGFDPKHTEVYFKDITSADINDVVSEFGSHPRLALTTSTMYEGRIVDKFLHVYNVYTTAARRSEVGPYIFGCLLGALWNDGKVLKDNDTVPHASSYTKIRVGCNVKAPTVLGRYEHPDGVWPHR